MRPLGVVEVDPLADRPLGLEAVRRSQSQWACIRARLPVVIVWIDRFKSPDRHFGSPSGAPVDGTPLANKVKLAIGRGEVSPG